MVCSLSFPFLAYRARTLSTFCVDQPSLPSGLSDMHHPEFLGDFFRVGCRLLGMSRRLRSGPRQVRQDVRVREIYSER